VAVARRWLTGTLADHNSTMLAFLLWPWLWLGLGQQVTAGLLADTTAQPLYNLACTPLLQERKRDEGEDQEAAETAAGDNPAPDGSSTKPQQQQQQQQVVVERTRSRELQLEFVVDSPLPQHRGQVRRGRRLARATSIKGKVKRAVGSSRPCPEGAAAGAGDTTPVSTS